MGSFTSVATTLQQATGLPAKDSNDNLYFVAKQAAGTVGMWKSTDDGATWTEQDTANRPAIANGTIASISAFYHTASDKIVVAAYGTSYTSGMSSVRDVECYEFNLSDAASGADTWTLEEAIVTTSDVSGVTGNESNVAISVETNNEHPHVVYTDVFSTMGTDYWHLRAIDRNFGLWSDDGLISGGVGRDEGQARIVREPGTSNVFHILYEEFNGAGWDIHAVTWNPNATFSTPVVTNAVAAAVHELIAWEDGGSVVRFGS